MITLRCRLKRLLLPPIILVFSLTLLFLIIINKSSFVRYPFYYTSIPGDEIPPPGRYSMTWTPNHTYCNFRYGLPEELLYEENDLKYSPQQLNESSFRIIYDVIKGGSKANRSYDEVTYVTHVTSDFINYIAEIVRYWDGPVSVAAFVPDSDADLAIKQLNQLCHCIPQMYKLSIHFVFPADSPPYLQNNPIYEAPQNCQITDSAKLATYRSENDLIYPVNVCRNVAREAARTYYVMVTDIQLIPSDGLAKKFMTMVERLGIRKERNPSRVFVVPVFEVESVVPRTKEHLLEMIKQEQAVYFHRHICSHCQKFPGMVVWMGSDCKNIIKPFVSVKREYPYHRWEPIFIGSKYEPLYPELLSWEGLQDKMTQNLEMCLIGYKYIILDGAFLVHWPGIKKNHYKLDNIWRTPFKEENSKQYKDIVKKLANKYGHNHKCRLR